MPEKTDSVSTPANELHQPCSDDTSPEDRSNEPDRAQSSEDIAIDWAAATGICDDESVIQEIAKVFLNDAPQTMASIAFAIKAENPADIQLHSHKLKGAALSIGASRVPDIAHRLECAGREKDMQTAAALLEELKTEFDKLISFLSQPDWIEIAKQQENKEQPQLSQVNEKQN